MPNFTQIIAPIHSQLADDPDLFELVRMFVDEMPARIEQLLCHFDSKNWGELKSTTHKIKGTVGCYGFGDVVPAARKLEQALKRNMPEENIRQSLVELIDLCKRMAVQSEPQS